MIATLRLVQYLTILMLLLNSILLMLSRGEVWPSILLAALPLPIWWMVDKRRWYQLPTWSANTIGLGIGAYALYFFWNQATERHLSVVSDMVCYLLLTMLLQGKSPRLYWQIAVLSVLQSVIASVFSLNLQQGVLFVIYIGVVLSTLALIVLNRDQMVATFTPEDAPRGSRVGRRSRLAGTVLMQPQRMEWSAERLRNVLLSIAALTLVSVGTGMAVYVTMPRLDENLTSNFLRLKTTGVTRQIESLEPSGVLTQNTMEALRVKVIDPSTGESVRLASDLYLRGSSLELLKTEETGWRPNAASSRPSRSLPTPTQGGKSYRQEIVMIPREDPLLFYATPAAPAFNAARELLYDLPSESLFRYSAENVISKVNFRYELGLHGLEGLLLPRFSPFLNFRTQSFDRPLNEDFDVRYQRLVQFNEEKYPTLLAKAKEIEASVPNGWRDRQGVATALSDYLSDSGEFTYTTDFRSIRRDRALDPVEDFVKNYRQGHCELYASALCLMLRSVNIPARVVVGYRTSRFNEVTGAYSVQEKHAHSWVEAYLAPRHCTPRMLELGQAGDGGAWMRLDPTPSSDALDDDGTNLLTQANDALGLAQSLWDEYVMGIQNTTPDSSTSMSRFSFLQTLLDPSAFADWTRRRLTQLNAWQRGGLALLIVLALFAFQWRARQAKRTTGARQSKRPQPVWKKLLNWVRGEFSTGLDSEHWADELLKTLERAASSMGARPRRPAETPMEFVEGWVETLRKQYFQRVNAQAESTLAIDDRAIDPGRLGGLADELRRLIGDYYGLKYAAETTVDRPRGNATPTAAQKERLANLLNKFAGIQADLSKLAT
jgi:hypothetical protein